MSTLTSDVFLVSDVTFGEICVATFSKLLLKYIVFTNVTQVLVKSQCKLLLCSEICFGRSKPENRAAWWFKFWYMVGKKST